MTAFERVVVGLDGSVTSLHALRWARSRFRDISGLLVVHAGTSEPDLPPDLTVGAVRCIDAPAAEALLRAADEHHADAVVVGAHGSGIGRGLGSVARKLLRDASVPVIVVEERDLPQSPDRPAPVIACVGYGAAADAASEWAADYAVEHELPLVLLHAVAYRPLYPVDSGSDVLASYLGTGVAATWALDELRSRAEELARERPNLEITVHVDRRSVVGAVQRAGETAELVVLGKRGTDEFLHSIGTPRLRRLVSRSKFPTAVVPCPSDD